MSFCNSKIRQNSYFSDSSVLLFVGKEDSHKVWNEIKSVDNICKLTSNNLNEKLSKKSFYPWGLDVLHAYFMDDKMNDLSQSYMSVDYIRDQLSLGDILPVGKILTFLMGKAVNHVF